MKTDCKKPVFYSVGRSVSDPVRRAEIKIKRSVFVCRLSYADTIEKGKGIYLQRLQRTQNRYP